MAAVFRAKDWQESKPLHRKEAKETAQKRQECNGQNTIENQRSETNRPQRRFTPMIELQDLDRVSAAEKARKALAEIQEQNEEGLLRAEDVVDTARSPDHPLHKYFTWDDSEAAEQWRLTQARHLIRKVLVIGPNGDEDAAPVPKYVSLRPDRKRKGGGYRKTSEVLSNKELLAQLEETAKKDLDAVLQRYEMLKGLVAKVRKAAGIEPKKKK